MSAARFVARNLLQFQKELNAADKNRIKAGQTAAKVEGFRLKGVLQQEIRAGAPGGKDFEGLSHFAKRFRPNRKPLAKLATAIRYSTRKYKDSLFVTIGFGSPTSRVSKSFMRLAALHQEGGEIPLGAYDRNRTFDTMSLRTRMVLIGAGTRSFGRGEKSRARYMFVRKSTENIKLPARPIIEPFWTAHQTQAAKNIMNNFEKKMRGERI